MPGPNYSGRIRVRGCALVVQNSSLLLVHQSVPTRNHMVWLAPGGEVELGESAKEAARRETKEETGLVIRPQQLVIVHEFIEEPFHAVELYFLSEIAGGAIKKGTDPEHAKDDQQIIDVQYLPFDRLKDLNVVPEFLKNIREVIESTRDGHVMVVASD